MSRTRVFVGGLTYRCTERDLEKFFRKYGRIKEIAMKTGFAFVEFDDYRDAEDAIYELNGKELLGERVSVERARGTPRGSDQWRGSGRGFAPPRRRGSRDRGSGRYQSSRRDENSRGYGGERYGPPTRTDYRVYVENLSSRVSWQDLKDYMRQEGCEVTYADAHKEHRNEAIVEFATYNDMKTALEKLDGMELNGRRIRLVEEKRRRSRSGTRSRTRSRSKRRSRSRSHSRYSTRSKSKSKSRTRSRSRSVTKRSKSRSRSESKDKNGKSRSRSVDRVSKSRSRSASKPRNGESRSSSVDRHSRSRSRSMSNANGD